MKWVLDFGKVRSVYRGRMKYWMEEEDGVGEMV